MTIHPKSVELKLATASGYNDVELFYKLISKICEANDQDIFDFEGEKKRTKDIPKLRNTSHETMKSGFETLGLILEYSKDKKEGDKITVFGVRNPIVFDLDLLKELGSYEKYDNFLNDIQSLDYYYSRPFIMQSKTSGKIFGVFVIEVGTLVLPIDPSVEEEVSKWFAVAKEGGFIDYDGFISNYMDAVRYDSNHVIVSFTEKDVEKIRKQGIPKPE